MCPENFIEKRFFEMFQKMFVTTNGGNSVYEFHLSEGFDIFDNGNKINFYGNSRVILKWK